MTATNLLEVRGLCLETPAGRPLFRDLSLTLGRTDRVALVGRNGAGKSALLEVLAGRTAPAAGALLSRGRALLVPQELGCTGASPGELRRLRLEEARAARPDLLLLDEPTRDLDAAGCDWLLGWLSAWRGALVVVSHRPRVLRAFAEFFLVTESGCRHFSGSFDALVADVARETGEQEQRYLARLQRLGADERHRDAVLRRRERKKNRGRISELRRATPRIRLNAKRSSAQKYQGKRALVQQARIERVRAWTKAARRALAVELPLELALPALPPVQDGPIAGLERVSASASAGGRLLFEDLTLRIGRERLAIVGPNGSGKSTLLEMLAGLRAPAAGSARCDASRIGHVAQHGASDGSEECVLEHLARGGVAAEAAARILRAHRFPLALAERSLASLSPGERLRARLICLLQRRPAPELLLLDEPSEPLDFLGAAALQSVLATWPGGLVVVSHDRDLLRASRIETQLELGGSVVRRGSVG